MQNAAKQRSVSSSGGKVVPTFRVVIVYENSSNVRQAKQAYDFLVANLTHEWQVTSRMWKFDLLRIPELRELAAEDALLADLIIVSCNGNGELPAHVRTWIEMTLGSMPDAVALVALLDCPPGQAERAQVTQAYLERVAQRAHMEFFTWPQGLPRQTSLVLERALPTKAEPLRQAA
jgi:hypothetical protein